jgi:phosphonate transport system substrate-binding protein
VTNSVLMGAVAYDAKVVTIWSGFRSWLRQQGLDFDYVLYSNYERQVEDLVAGRIDAAWNSPLAWIRAVRLAKQQSYTVRPGVMRDTDRDLTSVILVRSDSDIAEVQQLTGRTVGVGAIDSPQATLIPLAHLARWNVVATRDLSVVYHNVGVGLHGDHIGGEREAARALLDGTVDACCIVDSNNLLFTREGTTPAGSTRVLTQTSPYDHCNMTLAERLDPDLAALFTELLLSMSYENSSVRPLLDLEGLKRWLPGRLSGYTPLEDALRGGTFLDAEGNLTAETYRP